MSQTLKNWLLLLFLSCIWGSSFILMKRGMTHNETGTAIFNNHQVATLRMLLASLSMLPFGLFYIKKHLTKRMILPLLGVGFLGNFIPAFLFTYAETGISSGLTGMLNSATPIFTILVGAIFYKQSIIKLQVIGVLIGTLGIIGLVSSGASVETSTSLTYVLAVIVATLCYASSVNIIKFNLNGVGPLIITAIAFSLTFIPALILFFTTDTLTTFKTNTYAWNGFLYIAVLALVGTSFSVIVFNQLIANSSPLFASSVTYFIPIIAALIGFWDKEHLTFYQILAMGVILIGVFTANVLGRRKKTPKKVVS